MSSFFFFTIAYQRERVNEIRLQFEATIQHRRRIFDEFERIEHQAFLYARDYLHANVQLVERNRPAFRAYNPYRPISPGARSDDSDATVEFDWNDYRRSPSPVLRLDAPRSPSPMPENPPRAPSPEIIQVDDSDDDDDVQVVEVQAVIEVQPVVEDQPEIEETIVPNCQICTDLVFNHEPTVLRRCGHLFCSLCVDTWFETQPTLLNCPTCRTPVLNVQRDVIRVYI